MTFGGRLLEYKFAERFFTSVGELKSILSRYTQRDEIASPLSRTLADSDCIDEAEMDGAAEGAQALVSPVVSGP